MTVKSQVTSHSASQAAMESQPPSARPAPPKIAEPGVRYEIRVNEDGSAEFSFTIRPDILTRIQRRAYKVPLDEYIWVNIIRPNLQSHVF